MRQAMDVMNVGIPWKLLSRLTDLDFWIWIILHWLQKRSLCCAKKTKAMYVDSTRPDASITISDQNIKYVEKCTFLGSHCNTETDVNYRKSSCSIQLISQLWYMSVRHGRWLRRLLNVFQDTLQCCSAVFAKSCRSHIMTAVQMRRSFGDQACENYKILSQNGNYNLLVMC